jgi:hypothetical protein
MKTKRKNLNGQSALAAARCSAAIATLERNIMRLEAHRIFWEAAPGKMETLPSYGQCGMIIADLKKCRDLLRQNS